MRRVDFHGIPQVHSTRSNMTQLNIYIYTERDRERERASSSSGLQLESRVVAVLVSSSLSSWQKWFASGPEQKKKSPFLRTRNNKEAKDGTGIVYLVSPSCNILGSGKQILQWAATPRPGTSLKPIAAFPTERIRELQGRCPAGGRKALNDNSTMNPGVWGKGMVKLCETCGNVKMARRWIKCVALSCFVLLAAVKAPVPHQRTTRLPIGTPLERWDVRHLAPCPERALLTVQSADPPQTMIHQQGIKRNDNMKWQLSPWLPPWIFSVFVEVRWLHGYIWLPMMALGVSLPSMTLNSASALFVNAEDSCHASMSVDFAIIQGIHTDPVFTVLILRFSLSQPSPCLGSFGGDVSSRSTSKGPSSGFAASADPRKRATRIPSADFLGNLTQQIGQICVPIGL